MLPFIIIFGAFCDPSTLYNSLYLLSFEAWLVINPIPRPPCCPLIPSAVHGDHLITPDGHAEVHRWWLQGGIARGKETFLFPGRQTLHVLLSNQQLPREGKHRRRAYPGQSDPWVYGLFNARSNFFLCCLQAREMLSLKLPTWQEKCCDITKVPDTVMSMIEGLSSTPEQSPLVERYNRVSVICPGVESWHKTIRLLQEKIHSLIV